MDRNDEIRKLRDAVFRLEEGEDISLEEAKEIYDIQRKNKDRLDCSSNDFDGRLYGFVHRWYETVRDVLKDRTGNFITSLPVSPEDPLLKQINDEITAALPVRDRAGLIMISSFQVPDWLKKIYDPNRQGKIRYLEADRKFFSLDGIAEDLVGLMEDFRTSDVLEKHKRMTANMVLQKCMKLGQIPFLCFVENRDDPYGRFYFLSDEELMPEARRIAKSVLATMIGRKIITSSVFSPEVLRSVDDIYGEICSERDSQTERQNHGR